MKKIFLLFLFLFSLSSNAQKSESLEIYSNLINEFKQAKRIVITDYTSIGFTDLDRLNFEQLRKEFSEFKNQDLQEETFKDFKNQNINSEKILKSEIPNDKIVLISREEVDKIFKNNRKGWDNFYRKFPKSQGILTLSKIGFNENKTQAIVYYGNQSHYLAGIGYLAYYIKINDSWKLVGLSELWIS